MKNLILTIFLMLFTITIYAQDCPPLDEKLLSTELTLRQSQLQNSLDECPNITDAVNLARVFLQLEEIIVAEEVMLDALNDVVKTNQDRALWLQGNIDIALESNKTCQASQYLNELGHLSGYEAEYKKFRKRLYSKTQNQILNSKTIGCALAETRSVSFRGMKIKPKIDLAIHFDFNSDHLTKKGKQQSNQLANALNSGKLNNSQLVLIGHTDSIGTDAYNLDLSQRRSESVKKYLLTIDSNFDQRISTKGLGESQLLSAGTFDHDHQLNRRVEIQIQ